MERRQSDAASDFFDRGQEINQVPRSSIIEMDVPGVKAKVVRSCQWHTLLDLFMTINMMVYWIRQPNFREYGRLKSEFATCLWTVMVPALLLKLRLLTCAKHLNARKYKSQYTLACWL